MDPGVVEMTKGLAAEVWRNTNKLEGLVEGDGAGRWRFWACMHMFKKEGLVRMQWVEFGYDSKRRKNHR